MFKRKIIRDPVSTLMQTAPKMIVGLAFFLSFVQSSTAYAKFEMGESAGAAMLIFLLSPILIPLFLIALLIDVRFSRGIFLLAAARFAPHVEEHFPQNKDDQHIETKSEPKNKETGWIRRNLKLFFTPINKLSRKNHHANTKTLLLALVVGPITSVLTYYTLKTFVPIIRPVLFFLEPLPTLALPLLPILTKIGLLLAIAFMWTKFGDLSKHQHKEIPITGVEPLKEKQPKESSIISVEQLKAAIEAEAEEES